MSFTCDICMNENQYGVSCELCSKIICIECYDQLDKCPFCRLEYDCPSSKLFNERMNMHYRKVSMILADVRRQIALMQQNNIYH